jgi:DNA-binding winged helix-turn-helix (wHTH) protein/tetratricopeptide (TPR) repeat protein
MPGYFSVYATTPFAAGDMLIYSDQTISWRRTMSLQKFPSFVLDFSEQDMKGENDHFYGFGRFALNVQERRLSDPDHQISLTPKAFDVLALLVGRAGHLVEKEELMSHVWPDSFVEEANVARIVHTLRKKLGDDGNGNSFIETVPTRGYRFVAAVQTIKDPIIEEISETTLAESERPAMIARQAIETESMNEPSPEGTFRRHYFVLAGIVVLSVLVTGFWASNGFLMPRTLARISGHSMNGEAYRHYQEGKALLDVRTPENYQNALEHFEKAIELDPGYAEAYAGKADAKSSEFTASRTNDDIANAQAAVKKALELDPDNSYAHTIKCRILGTYDWEFEEAVTECRRAVALGPNDDRAHRELGYALNVMGRSDEALSEMQATVAISPTSYNKRSVGIVFYMSRRFDEALQQFLQVNATDPGTNDVERWLMSCFAMKGDSASAFEALVKQQETDGMNAEDIRAIKTAFSSGDWLAAVRETMNSSSGTVQKQSLLAAALFAQIGEKDKAFDVLDNMRKRRALMRIYVAREPMLDPLRGDRRFEAILSQMNLQ